MLVNDIIKFISSLSFVDIVFFSAIITLLILVVILIYFIKINHDVISDNYFKNDINDNNKNININNNLEINKEQIINNYKSDEVHDSNEVENLVEEPKNQNVREDEYNDEEGELLDLESLTKKLQSEQNNDVFCNDYERDQEEKAIISYEELLQRHNNYALNYVSEERLDDLIVKKVDLTDFENKSIENKEKNDVRVISYDNEEAFLHALKELNSLLN